MAPHDVNIVFHHGGGTDRYINYRVYNQHGESLADVEYAFMNGGTHFVPWPCALVGIESPEEVEDGELRTEVYDLAGRLMHRVENGKWQAESSNLPAGIYLVRTVGPKGVSTKKQIVY